MRSVGRFSYARIAYLAVVSTALVVVSVRAMPGDTDPGSTPGIQGSTATVPTSLPATTTDPGSSVLLPTTSTKPARTTPAGRPSPTTTTPPPPPGTVPSVTTTITTVAPTTSHQSSPTPAPTTTRPAPTSTTSYPPNAIVMVIPFGTYARIQNGDDIEDVMPAVLNARVGQTLYLVNKDEYAHLYGNVAVNPYRTTIYPFTYPGDQIGFCTVGPTRTITFRVSA